MGCYFSNHLARFFLNADSGIRHISANPAGCCLSSLLFKMDAANTIHKSKEITKNQMQFI